MVSFGASTASLRPLVFDLDGTLIDSRGDIAAACNHTLRESGRPELPVEVISSFVGSGARALLLGALGETVDGAELDALLEVFVAYYAEHPVEHNRILPGALEALERDSGRALALCTNKPAQLTERVLQELGWVDLFDIVVAPGATDKKKPHAEPLLKVAGALGVAPDSLIMIGDAPQDVGAGKAVGAHTIGVRGGFLGDQVLLDAHPDVVLDSLSLLSAYLSEAGI